MIYRAATTVLCRPIIARTILEQGNQPRTGYQREHWRRLISFGE